MHSLENLPHVIAITEIKPKMFKDNLQSSGFNLDGYRVFCHELQENSGRGLLLYVASDIDVSLIDIPIAYIECIFLVLKGTRYSNSLLIGNIYRSPNSTLENDNKLFDQLQYVELNYQIPKLLVGDFNYSNIEWYSVDGLGISARYSGLTANEMLFDNTLSENLLMQHVVLPTRQRGTDTPHILDLVLSSDDIISDIEYP